MVAYDTGTLIIEHSSFCIYHRSQNLRVKDNLDEILKF